MLRELKAVQATETTEERTSDDARNLLSEKPVIETRHCVFKHAKAYLRR